MPDTQFRRVGEMYVRGTFSRSVSASGTEKCLFAKWIPMLCAVEEYWINVRAIGNITGTVPGSSEEMHVRAAISDVNFAQEMVETDDFDGDELLDRYFDPRTGSSFSGDDGDPPTDLGLSDATIGTRSALYAMKELFSQTHTLGLPDSAVFSDANQITYVKAFSRHGLVSRQHRNLELPGAVAVGVTVDAIAAQTDWSLAMGGDLGGMNDLYREILEHIGSSAGADIALSGLGVGLDNPTAAMFDYINNGYRATGIDVDQALNLRVRGTLKVGVYDAIPGTRILTAYR